MILIISNVRNKMEAALQQPLQARTGRAQRRRLNRPSAFPCKSVCDAAAATLRHVQRFSELTRILFLAHSSFTRFESAFLD